MLDYMLNTLQVCGAGECQECSAAPQAREVRRRYGGSTGEVRGGTGEVRTRYGEVRVRYRRGTEEVRGDRRHWLATERLRPIAGGGAPPTFVLILSMHDETPIGSMLKPRLQGGTLPPPPPVPLPMDDGSALPQRVGAITPGRQLCLKFRRGSYHRDSVMIIGGGTGVGPGHC